MICIKRLFLSYALFLSALGIYGQTTWDGVSWSAGAPDKNVDAIIAADALYSELIAGGAAFNCNNLTFPAGYTIDIDISPTKFTIWGDVKGGGNFVNSTGTSNVQMMIRGTTILGGQFNVPSGAMLHLNPGPVTTNGYLVLDPGAILHTNAATGASGNVTVKQKGSTSATAYNLWSSPISGASLGTVFSGANNIYQFADGGKDASAWSAASGVMGAGKGYMITGTGGAARSFIGTLNSTDQIYNPTSTGFCLIGNPFPCLFDLGEFFATNGHLSGLAAMWVDDGSNGSGYADNDYASWTSLGGTAASSGGVTPNGYLLPGQGFFVNVKSKAPISFSLSNHTSVIATNNSETFFKQAAPIERVWLSMTNPDSSYSEMLVGFTDSATNAYDRLYDGKKVVVAGNIGIYSMLNSEAYCIQGFPSLKSNKVIPLGLVTNTSDTYTIYRKKQENLPVGVKVYLEDNLNNVFHDFDQGPYQVALSADTFENRFSLHMELLTTDLNLYNAEENIKIFNRGNSLFIDGINSKRAIISIYDISGKLIEKDEFVGEIYQRQVYSRGLYVINVQIGNASVYKKVYIN